MKTSHVMVLSVMSFGRLFQIVGAQFVKLRRDKSERKFLMFGRVKWLRVADLVVATVSGKCRRWTDEDR
jgi:hypothetical protein